MTHFELKGMAKLLHLNVRKEGPGEAKHLTLDVKLQMITSGDICAFFNPTLRTLLFNDEGEPRIANMKPLQIDGTIKRMDVKFGEHLFRGVELRKFKFEPLLASQLAFSFTATLEPQGVQVKTLAELVDDTLPIDISASDALDFGDMVTAPMRSLAEKTAADTKPLRDIADEKSAPKSSPSPDELYESAKEIVFKSGRVSISQVQRSLRIGYNRAARLIEQMQGDGFVSPLNKDGQRTIIQPTEKTITVKLKSSDTWPFPAGNRP